MYYLFKCRIIDNIYFDLPQLIIFMLKCYVIYKKLYKTMLTFFLNKSCVFKRNYWTICFYFLWYICHFLNSWRFEFSTRIISFHFEELSIFCIGGGLAKTTLVFFYLKVLLFHLYSERILFLATVGIIWGIDFFFFQHFKNAFTLSLASIVSDKKSDIFEISFAF